MTQLSAPWNRSRAFRHETGRSTPLAPDATADTAANCTSSHPAVGAPPGDIVAHLLATHHRSLCERLPWIETLLEKSAARRGGKGGVRAAALRQFSEFQQELECGLWQERCAVFPLVVRRGSADDAGLRHAMRAVQKSHARTLKLLWALAEQVAQAAQLAPAPESDEALAAAIADLRDDYYQHLYEVECLLFPQITAPPAATSAAP